MSCDKYFNKEKKRNCWAEVTDLFVARKYVVDAEKNEFGK
jgi:hypothetical protein